MEEITAKLGKDCPVTISEGISKLLEEILKNKGSKNDPALQLLKEKCSADKVALSVTALQGLMKLVDLGILSPSHALSSLISMLPFANNSSMLVSMIGSLLVLDMKQQIAQQGSYVCQFNLVDCQHPMIIVLNHKKNEMWEPVLNFIMAIFSSSCEFDVKHKLEMLGPVLNYIFMNPNMEVLAKFQLFKIIVSQPPNEHIFNFILSILLYQQVDMSFCWCLLEAIDYFESAQQQILVETLVPLLAVAVKWLVVRGADVSLWKSCLLKHCHSSGASLVLIILADVMQQCSVFYTGMAVDIGCKIILSNSCNKFSACYFASTLLSWVMYSSNLTNSLPTQAEAILQHINQTTATWASGLELLGRPTFHNLSQSFPEVRTAANMIKLLEGLEESKETKCRWLTKQQVAESSRMTQTLVSSMMVAEMDVDIVTACLDVLLTGVPQRPDTACSVMCLILYKLSSETDPNMQLRYFTALPHMAILKENVALVLATFNSLQNCNKTTPLVIRLYLDLWKVEVRTYPYLHKLLATPTIKGEKGWEVSIAKATAIKEVCSTKPELHGKDLVLVLSELLNVCDDASGLPSSLAIDAILELCSAHVIDIVGTWKALQPKLSKDKRRRVLVSLCKLFGAVPKLKTSEAEYESLVTDVMSRLWGYVSSHDVQIVNAALLALSKFHLESFLLKALPESFRRGLRLPEEFAKTPVDAARRPEDVLPYVPGECWVQVLLKVHPDARSCCVEMLRSLLAQEVSLYPRRVYNLPLGASEPKSYSYLPAMSIARALVDFLVKELATGSTPVVDALKVLNKEYSKTLPPLSWTFLQEGIDSSAVVARECLRLAAKEGCASPSAKQIIEEHVKNFNVSDTKVEEIIMLFEMLPLICNAVQPNSLRAFSEQSLRLGLRMTLNLDSAVYFQSMMEGVKSAMKAPGVHEANKTLLSNQIEGLLPAIPAHHKVLKIYSECVRELSAVHIERLSSPSVCWEVTPTKLRQALAIRTAVAMRPDNIMPLVWLNEIIDAVGTLPDEHSSVLYSVLEVCQEFRDSDSNVKWLTELLGRTQAALSSNEDAVSSITVAVFLLDILMASTIVLAGHDLFVDNIGDIVVIREIRVELFPAALHCLLKKEKWKPLLPMVAEWMYRLTKRNEIPPPYIHVLKYSLLALRQSSYITSNSRWQRLLDVRLEK